ncbi:MAG: hypothetical protein WBE26_01985 [Phycisphaerae bacterium]
MLGRTWSSTEQSKRAAGFSLRGYLPKRAAGFSPRGYLLGLVSPFLVPLLVGLAGCGTNLNELLYQSASALGRTYLDLLLTDAANNVADALDEDGAPPSDEGEDDGDTDDGNGDDEDGGGVSFDDLTGDPAAGEPLYASCAGCHCADASGGCLPGATGLVGASAESLDEFLRGGASHPSSDLTDQEIVDLEAYLASLGG